MRRRGLISSIILMLLLLSGCNNRLEEKMSGQIDNDLIKDSLQHTTLDFYLSGEEPTNYKDALKLAEEKCDLNIELNFNYINRDNYYQEIKKLINANENVDAFYSFGGFKYQLDEMYLNQQLKDITELVPKYAPNIHKQLKDEGIYNVSKRNGQLYLLPPNNVLQHNMVVFIDNKYNVTDTINTFGEYIELLKGLKQQIKDDNTSPGLLPIFSISGLIANAYGYVFVDQNLWLVYKWDDPDMTILALEETPEYKETMLLFNDAYKDGLLTQDYRKNYITNISPHASVYGDGITSLSYYDGSIREMAYQTLYRDQKLRKVPINAAWAFNTNSPDVERCLMFLDWVQTDIENYKLINYGIEDKNYRIVNESPQVIDSIYNNGLFDNKTYELIIHKKFFDQNKQDLDKREDFFDKRTAYAPHEGFYIDKNDTIKNRCDTRKKKINRQCYNALGKGEYNLNAINAGRETLKPGREQLINEIQVQLDAWRKQYKDDESKK